MKRKLSDSFTSQEIERKEKNDCTVVALAHMCDISYEKAYKYLELHGRKKEKGMFFERFISKMGYKLFNKKLIKMPKFNTLNQFLEANLNGNYLVMVRGHVFVVKDGKIFDTHIKNYRIINIYLIKEIINEYH